MSDLTVDGVDMKTLAKNVETLAATLRTPARRGTNAVTAGRSGVIRTPDKLHEAPVYVWPMWVVGTDDDGSIPADSSSAQQFRNNVDDLTALFGKDGALDVRHTQPGSITADVTNLVTNPAGRNTSGTVTVRTNLCSNPNLEAGLNGWGRFTGLSTIEPDAGAAYSGSMGGLATVDGTADAPRVTYLCAGVVSAGDVVTISAHVRKRGVWTTSVNPIAIVRGPNVGGGEWFASAGVTFSQPDALGWQRVWITGTVGPDTNGSLVLNFGFTGGAGNIEPAGAQFEWDEVLAEKSSVLGEYFDGSTPAAGDFTYAWSGAANASTSKQFASAVVGWLGTDRIAVYRSPLGVTARRNEISPGAGDNYIGVGGGAGAVRLGMQPGGTYTVIAKLISASAAGDSLSRTIEFYWNDGTGYRTLRSPVAPISGGEIRITFQVPVNATEAFIRLQNGVMPEGAINTWAYAALIEGDYTGDYFDGSSGPGFTWDGEPDASTSTQHTDVRQADCECLTAIDFSTFGADPTGKFAVELQNLNAYWADTFDTVAVLAPDDHDMPGFLGATAPLDDAALVVTGPATNPRIEDYNKGSYIQYNDVIAAGQTLTIDADSMTLEGSGGLVPDFSKLQIVGMAGRMFRLVPAYKAGYAARLTASATSAATSLSITGRRKYLVG